MSSIHQQTLDYLTTHLDDLLGNYPNIMTHFAEKAFKVIDTDIHPKVLADWNRKGLLLEKPAKNKMHRFSLTEFAWVKMIDKMRKFNLPLEIILAARTELAQPIHDGSNDIWDIPELNDVMKMMLGEEEADKMTEFMKDPKMREAVNKSVPNRILNSTQLDSLLLFCLLSRSPLSFLINLEGKGLLLSPILLATGQYDEADLQLLMNSSYVSISLTEILAETLVLTPLESIEGKLDLLSSKELTVLEALRSKGVSSVHVRFDNNEEMDLLEVTSEQSVAAQTRLLELMLTDGYQDITLKSQNGVIVHCTNTRKTKLK